MGDAPLCLATLSLHALHALHNTMPGSVTLCCASGGRVTPGHGPKAGDDWRERAERVWLPVPADPGHHGGRLLLHTADIHVAEEPRMAQECRGLLVLAGAGKDVQRVSAVLRVGAVRETLLQRNRCITAS